MAKQFVVCLEEIRLARRLFVYLHKTGKDYSTRVWADTATKFNTYKEAQAIIGRFGLVGARIYGTSNNGKTIALAS